MSLNKDFICIFSLVSMVLIIIVPVYGFALCESDVESSRSVIELAEDSLEHAYLSLLEAESSGGDVSELVSLLNTALEYYSEAERALLSGEYETAVLLAGKVAETSNVILEADISLKVVAEHLEEVGFRNQLFLSSGVVCFTILFGFLSWRLFKGYYVRRMTGLRREVSVDES